MSHKVAKSPSRKSWIRHWKMSRKLADLTDWGSGRKTRMMQPTSWQCVSRIKWRPDVIIERGIMTLYLCNRNGHFFIKRTNSSLEFHIRETKKWKYWIQRSRTNGTFVLLTKSNYSNSLPSARNVPDVHADLLTLETIAKTDTCCVTQIDSNCDNTQLELQEQLLDLARELQWHSSFFIILV